MADENDAVERYTPRVGDGTEAGGCGDGKSRETVGRRRVKVNFLPARMCLALADVQTSPSAAGTADYCLALGRRTTLPSLSSIRVRSSISFGQCIERGRMRGMGLGCTARAMIGESRCSPATIWRLVEGKRERQLWHWDTTLRKASAGVRASCADFSCVSTGAWEGVGYGPCLIEMGWAAEGENEAWSRR